MQICHWYEKNPFCHSGLDPESSVFLFTNEGKGKDTGFPIKNVGNDRLTDGIPFSSLGVQAVRLQEGFYLVRSSVQ